MTIRQAIDRADELRPNALSDEMKLLWLAQLDGVLRGQILARHSGADPAGPGADAPGAADGTVLLAPEPYSAVYLYWLMAQVDLALGELTRYTNDMKLYNGALEDFAVWYKTHHRPVPQGQFRL